jgi:hypothetical protein
MILKTLLIIALFVIGLPFVMFLFVLVHRTMVKICVRHARKFCDRKGLKVNRYRWQPAFDRRGVKTEFTLVQLDCLDAQKQRRLLVLAVWPLGFRKIASDEPYPDGYDEKWPETPSPRH